MFRFTIRDLLWSMVVVGLAVAWRLEHRRLTANVQRLLSDNVSLAEQRNQALSEREYAWTKYHDAYLEWMGKRSDLKLPEVPKPNLKNTPYQDILKRPRGSFDPPELGPDGFAKDAVPLSPATAQSPQLFEPADARTLKHP